MVDEPGRRASVHVHVIWRSGALYYADGRTLKIGLGNHSGRDRGPIIAIAGLGGEGSITCDVIEALGRPYEYDKGVLEELTDLRTQD